MSDPVLLHVSDGVATLVLNRPEALNALNFAMMEALPPALERIRADASVRVVLVKGAGEHFMAGGDLRDFATTLDLPPEQRQALFQATLDRVITSSTLALRQLAVPVVAQVSGACAGFGLSLVLACDLIVAADTAYFTTAYGKIALSPDGGQSFFLPRVVGSKQTMELLLLSERIPAPRALELGLVNRVVPPAELEAASLALVARLQAGPRQAYSEIKRLVNASYESSLSQQLDAEASAFARCSASDDFVVGIQSFMQKRAPKFG